MGWSKKDFWQSTPNQLYSCYFQHGIMQGWFKTKESIEEEKQQKTDDSIKKLRALAGNR